MSLKTIQQGAEAEIMLDKKNNLIIKNRTPKLYRHPELDKQIRKKRTKVEIKLLEKASKIIDSAKPRESKEFDKIIMPFIRGKKLSEYLDKFPLKKKKEICREIGKSIAKLHKNHIIHGDLTTSNMILAEKPGKSESTLIKLNPSKRSSNLINPNESERGTSEQLSINKKSAKIRVFFIDFGLGYISQKIEDKAVDLHLLKQAFEAKHFKHYKELLEEIFKSYKKILGKTEFHKISERIKAVEKRGRYRH